MNCSALRHLIYNGTNPYTSGYFRIDIIKLDRNYVGYDNVEIIIMASTVQFV